MNINLDIKSEIWLTAFQGCGVGGVECFQLESVFKAAGVGVSFSKLHESESGIGTFIAITDSNVY